MYLFSELNCFLFEDETKSICLSQASGSVNLVKQLLWQAGAEAWEGRWGPDLWATCFLFLFFFPLGQIGTFKELCPAMEHIHKAKLNSIANTKLFSNPRFKLNRVPQARKNYKRELCTGDKLPVPPQTIPSNIIKHDTTKGKPPKKPQTSYSVSLHRLCGMRLQSN